MNTDKAYLLGLIIGGGVFGNAEDVFRIKLPYKQWGSYEQNPDRAGKISSDILTVISPMFKNIYGLNISYDTSISGTWNILCEGDSASLKTDLQKYGIECYGALRRHADISDIIADLTDDNLKRRFIAGLADTIGSTNKNQRRFGEDKQIISFEIGGESFNFVCSLCKLLYSINCYPDQVLWQHPNLQCGSNPFYSSWKTKGHKIRILLDQYAEFGAFAFKSKAHSSLKNRQLEKQPNTAEKCEDKKIKKPSFTCVHHDENSDYLPNNIRGGHYIHNKHICAVMGCEHAPYSQISCLIEKAEEYINPFPILIKGTTVDISKIVTDNPLYSQRIYNEHNIQISSLYSEYQKNANGLVFSTDGICGYPINQIMKAITFVVAGKIGVLTKSGGSANGKMNEIIDKLFNIDSNAFIKIQKPDLLTPIVIILDDYSALVGACNPRVYKKLITIENEYKLYVRPITEEDLKNE